MKAFEKCENKCKKIKLTIRLTLSQVSLDKKDVTQIILFISVNGLQVKQCISSHCNEPKYIFIQLKQKQENME